MLSDWPKVSWTVCELLLDGCACPYPGVGMWRPRCTRCATQTENMATKRGDEGQRQKGKYRMYRGESLKFCGFVLHRSKSTKGPCCHPRCCCGSLHVQARNVTFLFAGTNGSKTRSEQENYTGQFLSFTSVEAGRLERQSGQAVT